MGEAKIQRTDDFYRDILKDEIQCQIAEYNFGKLLREGVIVDNDLELEK